jgi:hypothetical protein
MVSVVGGAAVGEEGEAASGGGSVRDRWEAMKHAIALHDQQGGEVEGGAAAPPRLRPWAPVVSSKQTESKRAEGGAAGVGVRGGSATGTCFQSGGGVKAVSSKQTQGKRAESAAPEIGLRGMSERGSANGFQEGIHGLAMAMIAERHWTCPTSLHFAAEAGDCEKIMALIAAGEDVNARDCGGRTPLHLAAQRGDCGAIRILLAAGANPFIGDKEDGKPPLWYAIDWGQREAVILLKTANPGWFGVGPD